MNGRRLFLRCSHTGNNCPVGMQTPLDPDLFRCDLIPHVGWHGEQSHEEAVAGANRCSMHPTAYASGLLLSVHRLEAGRIILNTFRILEHLGCYPAADRLLVNMLRYAGRDLKGPLVDLPADFADRLFAECYSPAFSDAEKRSGIALEPTVDP